MLEFKCMHCGAGIGVAEGERGRPVVCLSCNTRQRVPENAVKVPDRAVLEVAAKRERVAPAMKAPTYELLTIAAFLVIVCGVLEGIVAVAVGTVTGSIGLVLGAIGGVVTAGLGALMLCIRDIAIHTWHLRYKR